MATTTTQLEQPAHELSSPAEWKQTTVSAPDSAPNNVGESAGDFGNEDGNHTSTSGGPSTATVLKIMSASFSFFVAGVNDGSVGAIIPYVIREYNVNTAIVSSVYGATFAGWVFAALTNTHLCQYLDLGSMLFLGAGFQIVAHSLRAWMPPFGLFVTTFFFAAVGQAYNDTHANTFVAGVKGAHRWLAVIHASFMGGCLTGPFVATAIASAGGDRSTWYLFYAFPVGISVINMAIIAFCFRDSLVFKRKASAPPAQEETTGQNVASNDGDVSRNKDALALIKSTLHRPSVWLLSMFYFFYIGSQITSGGWVVEYLVDVRGGDLSNMGYVPAGFHGGCLLGRILLAEPTYRLGERRMVFFYCCIAVALQIVFWLVPNIIAASVAISFIGFFTGPLFATGISLGSKLFPHELHSTALAFVFVFAQMGGSLFPVVTGVVASRVGVSALQPILVGILTATTVSWLLVPRPKSTSGGGAAALHQE